MKIIVSHDVDHLYWSEHLLRDLYIPKHLFRSLKWWFQDEVSFSDFYYSVLKLTQNRLHRLPELVEFNKTYNIISTYFVGVNRGLGLSYSLAAAKTCSHWLVSQGQDVGVHGIDYRSLASARSEWSSFRAFNVSEKFGVRMHYLRNDEETLNLLSKAGYVFDSTVYGLKPPALINGMWEFPISLMESFLWREAGLSKERMLDASKARLDEAHLLSLPYFVIDFHDVNFDRSTSFFKNWYQSFIEFLVQNKFEFVTFHQAINELNEGKSVSKR